MTEEEELRVKNTMASSIGRAAATASSEQPAAPRMASSTSQNRSGKPALPVSTNAGPRLQSRILAFWFPSAKRP